MPFIERIICSKCKVRKVCEDYNFLSFMAYILPNNQTKIYLRTNKIVKKKHIILWDPKGLLIMKVNWFIPDKTSVYLKLCLQLQKF